MRLYLRAIRHREVKQARAVVNVDKKPRQIDDSPMFHHIEGVGRGYTVVVQQGCMQRPFANVRQDNRTADGLVNSWHSVG